MFAKGMAAAAIGMSVGVGLVPAAHAQVPVEQSAEVRMQLDLAVASEALKKLLPSGWEPFVATSGAAKDCNVRMIFVDRIDITGSDGAPVGTNQIVYLASPIKKSGSNEMAGQMVIGGLTADPNRFSFLI